jgi:hypothetical protein
VSGAVAELAGTDGERRWRHVFGAVLVARLLYPFFNSPLSHLYSDPLRHWANGARFLAPDLIGAGDPYLYQLYMYLLRALSADDPPTVLLACGVLCSAMPYGWYRALRELLPRRAALAGATIIGVVPGFISIYAYFMTETLLLTLTGFAFWATLRAWRKATLGAFTLAAALWTLAIFTRSVVLPMAALCIGTLWWRPGQRLNKAAVAVVAFGVLAVPAGMHAMSRLGFFAPLGNVYLSEIYSYSGEREIALDAGGLGRWGFGSPSFYNPTLFPFSGWTTSRTGTVHVKIDVARGRDSWVEERDRVADERTFPWLDQYGENLLYLLIGQSWPDNDPAAWASLLAVWTRWLWPALMLAVAWGAALRRFVGREWLLPICGLGMLVFLGLQWAGILEGRYRKPVDPVLLAAAIVLYARTQRAATGAGARG